MSAGSTNGALRGELNSLPAGAEGFVYVSNPHFYPVLVDMLVRKLFLQLSRLHIMRRSSWLLMVLAAM